jgi:hypothetical protein
LRYCDQLPKQPASALIYNYVGPDGSLAYSVPDVRDIYRQGRRNLPSGSPMGNAIPTSDVILNIGTGASFTDSYEVRVSQEF